MSPDKRPVSTIFGIPPALPANLTRQRVGESAQEQTARRLVEAEIDGLVLKGGTGVGMGHEMERRRAVVRTAHCRANNSILPITGCSTTEAPTAIEIAAVDRWQAFVALTYYHLLPGGANGVSCADLAEQSPLPIILCHIPETRNCLSVRAHAAVANITGLKEIPVVTKDGVEALGTRLTTVLEPLMLMAEAYRKVGRD